MEGVIVNFRQGMHTQHNTQMIVQPAGITSLDKAKALVGKVVVWKSPASREIKGKVAMQHGRNGAVRVIFEKGLPGQSVGQKVLIQ